MNDDAKMSLPTLLDGLGGVEGDHEPDRLRKFCGIGGYVYLGDVDQAHFLGAVYLNFIYH